MTNAGKGTTAAGQSAGGGVWTTFGTLARSGMPGARELLLAGLEQSDPGIQTAAARAILRFARKDGIPHLIGSFHTLAGEVADELVRSIDDFVYPLREVLGTGATESRANAVEIILRSRRVKLAYLLVQALSDGDASIASRALEGLRRMTETYHAQLDAARSGASDLSRTELETRKFALLDPIMALLSNLSRPQPDELLVLAMGLDVRANDILFNILNSKQDPRADRLARILRNSSSGQVVSFLYDALRDRRVSNVGATVIRQRRDLPFVKALLMNHRFFTDYRVRESLRLVESVDFLKGKSGTDASDVPRKDVFASALLALRAIHFVVLSGLAVAEKVAFLKSVAGAPSSAFVAGIAESVFERLEALRPPEEISPALVYLEREMGLRASAARAAEPVRKEPPIEMPELELPWADPRTQSLSEDAFTQFFNTFDSLDEATRLLAAQTLKRLDPEHLERVREELSSLEPERRLKAVRIVVALHREQAVEEALLSLASDPDRHVRATVVKTLGLLEDEPAIRTLLEAVTDADRRVVANSVEAIESVGRDELLGLVRIFAAHPNNRIRANAVKALWSMGERDAGKLLDQMLAGPDEMMRLSATWLLGEIDHTRRIEMLTKIARTDPSERVRAKASSILGEGA